MPEPVGPAVLAGIQVAGAIGDFFTKNAAILEDEVTVEVTGQPGAKKQELYFLALACANGMVRRFANLTLPPAAAGLLMIEYDAADHWVRCTMRYVTGMLATTDIGRAGHPAPFGGGAVFNTLAVYRGPQCKVVGGDFDFVSRPIAGVPSVEWAPSLPFDGSVILDSCPETVEPSPTDIINSQAPNLPAKFNGLIPSPNPKPPGDNRSRGVIPESKDGPRTLEDVGRAALGGTGGFTGVYFGPGPCCETSKKLIPLVFAALTDPGSFTKDVFPAPVAGPKGS